MSDNASQINKKAWEYRAYEFWNNQYKPEDLAAVIKENPSARLRYHQKYFRNVSGLKIANPCGSNGRIAVPLAMLGADITVFDISTENKKYALELASCAGVHINYEVCDFYEVPPDKYSGQFDIEYLEGGILHYFHDIDRLMKILFDILKPDGKLILSDFHPYRKLLFIGPYALSKGPTTGGDYFDKEIHSGDVAYKSFFSEKEQTGFPDCSLRFYTLSEIINAVINAGFTLKEFNEHPNWTDKRLPGEFTILAVK